MFKGSILALNILLALALAACSSSDTGNTPNAPAQVKVTGITIPATGAVEVGSTLTLAATVNPADATNKTLTWFSGDLTVATVNASGVVTALKAGSTAIAAAASDRSEVVSNTCLVTVHAVPPLGSSACTEFGREVWSDFTTVDQGPPANVFIGCWTHVVAPVGGGSKGNDYPFVLECSETVSSVAQLLMTISGNLGYDGGAGSWYYNQNITTNTGDYVTWYAHDTEAVCRGWVYVGWHFQKTGTDTLATQYLKFDTTGTVAITAQETISNETCTPINIHVGGGPRCSGNTTSVRLTSPPIS